MFLYRLEWKFGCKSRRELLAQSVRPWKLEYFKDHNLETFSNTFFQKYFEIFRGDCLKSLGKGKLFWGRKITKFTHNSIHIWLSCLDFGLKRFGMLMSGNILLHLHIWLCWLSPIWSKTKSYSKENYIQRDINDKHVEDLKI